MIRYAITDRGRGGVGEDGRRAALLRQAGELAEMGVDFLQLREKDLGAGALAALAADIKGVLRGRARGPRLLINSRADVAVAVGAEGVHLSSEAGALTAADVRRIYASAGLDKPVVSVSCHSVDEVVRAREGGASLILFGPVFEKVVLERVGGGAAREALVSGGVGLDVLPLACAAGGDVPVLALGGVTAENTGACLAVGAAGVAGIRLFG